MTKTRDAFDAWFQATRDGLAVAGGHISATAKRLWLETKSTKNFSNRRQFGLPKARAAFAKTLTTLKQTAKQGSAKLGIKPVNSSDWQRHQITEAELINAESALGGTLFGPVPAGHRREFFRFRHNIWFYHEAWDDQNKQFTLRFEVREHGVYKFLLGKPKATKLTGAELANFRAATAAYIKLVKAKLY